MKDIDKLYLQAMYDSIVAAEQEHHNRMADIIAKFKINLEKLGIEF